MRPLVEGFVERRESCGVLTKAGMDEREPVGRHEFVARQPFQLGEYLLGLIGAARGRGDEASRRNRNGPFVEHFLDLPKFCKCIVELSQLLKSPSKPKVRWWKVSVHLEHEFQLFRRLVVSARVIMVKTEVGIDWQGKRVALARKLYFPKSLSSPAGGQQIDTVPLMCRSVARIDCNRALERRVRAEPIPLEIQLDQAQ
jgi:hypothetical protein